MKKISWVTILFAGLFLILSSHFAWAKEIPVVSKISEVTIYPGGALVTRQADVDISEGEQTLLFEDIVPSIDENTLTVKAQGLAEAQIYGAFIKTENFSQVSDERVKALQDKIEDMDDQIVEQTNKQAVINKEAAFLDSIKLLSDNQVPKDLVTKMPSVTDLENVQQYIGKSYTDVKSRLEAIRQKLRDLNRKKEALSNDLQGLNTNASKIKRSIAIQMNVLHQGRLTVSVSYYVWGVDWEPVYDARVDFKAKKVDLSLFGLINQNTGEDWNNVQLTISTARPSIGGVMPELPSWPLRPVMMRPVYASLSYAGTGALNMADENTQSLRSVVACKSMAKAHEAFREARIVQAKTQLQGTNAVFKITRLVTVKSDGTKQRVPVIVLNLPAQFEYASTPKLVPYAFLRSKVENNQQGLLLPGRVNVFLDGDYVGNSRIDKALGTKEKFDLYLGADEGVKIKRQLLEQKSDDTLFANIPSLNKVLRYSYKITIENYKPLPITVNLFDNIPVSEDQKIKIKDVK
ncbi:MAG: mucoidy inhibitor MuiA family protein, partial [Candidatus Omnitrophica bacterium]|nr:mucoidy inhibitor MuiA family protein [Candidatus Omnitrophota bacterium]